MRRPSLNGGGLLNVCQRAEGRSPLKPAETRPVNVRAVCETGWNVSRFT